MVGLVGLRDRSFADLLDEGLAPTTVTPATLNLTFSTAPNGPARLHLRGRLDRRRPRHARAARFRRRQRLRQCAAHPHDARSGPLRRAGRRARPSPASPCSIRAACAPSPPASAAIRPSRRMGTQRAIPSLLDSVRSLDGSHQWRGTSMPFPRRQAWRTAPPPASAGYAFGADKRARGLPCSTRARRCAGPSSPPCSGRSRARSCCGRRCNRRPIPSGPARVIPCADRRRRARPRSRSARRRRPHGRDERPVMLRSRNFARVGLRCQHIQKRK